MTKSKVNMLAFKNIFQIGEEDMTKNDFVTSILMKAKRIERKLLVKKFIYNRVIKNQQSSPTVQEFFKRFGDKCNDN